MKEETKDLLASLLGYLLGVGMVFALCIWH
jgi:hypothetical protein